MPEKIQKLLHHWSSDNVLPSQEDMAITILNNRIIRNDNSKTLRKRRYCSLIVQQVWSI